MEVEAEHLFFLLLLCLLPPPPLLRLAALPFGCWFILLTGRRSNHLTRHYGLFSEAV